MIPSKFTDEELSILSKYSDENNKISIQDAIYKAEDIMALLDSSPETRSSEKRTIENVIALSSNTKSIDIQSATTRSVIELPDTVAYLFNFSDNMGFAIISADNRTEENVLAVVGDGKLEDTTDNPGLAIFLENAEDYISESISRTERLRDSLMESITAKIESEFPSEIPEDNSTKAMYVKPTYSTKVTTTYGDWQTTEVKSPLVPVDWGQGEPFNDKVKFRNCSNGTTPAGCVATATAQIMAYWKYPSKIENTTLNWNELNQYTGKNWWTLMYNAPDEIQDQAASLMEIIGSKIGMNYSCDGSGAQTSNATSYLRTLGYKNGYLAGYNNSVVINSISQGMPVIAQGHAKKINHKFLGITWYSTYEQGHAWVIDGYILRQQLVNVKFETTQTSNNKSRIISTTNRQFYLYSNLLHNNWGWSGYHNGYFANDSFNSNIVDLPSNTKSNQANNYQYKNEIFPYITK